MALNTHHLGLRSRLMRTPPPLERQLFFDSDSDLDDDRPKKRVTKAIEEDTETIYTESECSIDSEDDEHYTEVKADKLKKGSMVLLDGENYVAQKVTRRAGVGVIHVLFVHVTTLKTRYKMCDSYTRFLMLD